MPSDSIAGFLDRAQASRVLFPEQVEQLIRQPDIPQSDLAALCTYLLSRGVLTKFQADALRDGRGNDLSFAGYPVLDMIGPCPGGAAYQALHPSLRTPVTLRRFDPFTLGPTDSAEAVVNRARIFGMIQHPNLLPILDAGTNQGESYAVLEQPTDAADLGSLLKEVGGAMPGFLAAEYGWSLASALRAIHERGGWHGEVRPGLLYVGPITTKSNPDGTLRRRPSPTATVKLAESGLVAITPPAAERMPAPELLPYLPPERVDGMAFDARGDIYGLGASLYMLLAGRPPFPGDSPEAVLANIRSAEPVALASLRPDIPAELAAAVTKMLAKRPEDRPQTAAEVCAALAPFCRPGTLPATPQSDEIPQAVPMSTALNVPRPDLPVAVAVPHAMVATPVAASEPDGWGVNPNAFADAHAASAADTTQKRRRGLTEADKSKTKIWIALGLCLHLTAVAMIVGYAFGLFDPLFKSTPDPTPDTKRVDPPKKPREKKS